MHPLKSKGEARQGEGVSQFLQLIARRPQHKAVKKSAKSKGRGAYMGVFLRNWLEMAYKTGGMQPRFTLWSKEFAMWEHRFL